MSRRVQLVLCSSGILALCSSAGCMVPRSRLDACHAYNCQLQRRHQEICAQYENLRVQNQDLANKNLDLADKLAAQEELLARHQQRQSEWDQERSRFEGAYASLLDQSRSSPLPRDVSTQLEDLARRYQGIVDFDPATGISKFRSDVLFDSGLAELKPDYTSALADFAAIMNSSSARDLRIMIVGHTDERPIVRDSTRQAHPTNWHLSANRAIAVEQYLEQSGRISPNRMGAVGYGPYQPVASGRSPDALAKNRRVEIFVLSPDAPIVGRTNGASY